MKANYLPSYAFIRPKQLVLVQEKVLIRIAVIHFSKVKQLVLLVQQSRCTMQKYTSSTSRSYKNIFWEC